jgi:S-layer protein (TIGR01567 family)
MRTPIFALIILLFLATATSGTAAERVELRGSVAVAYDGATYTWDPQNFPGFSYDADDNIGNERLTLTITGSSLDEPMGVVYETTAQLSDFDFEDWGMYYKISFLGEEQFAGYAGERYDDWRQPYLYDRSRDDNLMAGEELSKILIDDDQERTITKEAPLRLAEGYELGIKGIDAYGSIWLELSKDGEVVDSNLIAPSKDGATIADKTYIYTRDLGISRGVVVIAVHFKGPVFHGTEGGLQDAAIVNGIWQISDEAISIGDGSSFGKMRISSVDAESMRITMDNEDNRIVLSKNKEIPLMEEFGIRTADQYDITPEEPMRFYVFKEITRPGRYEIRGSVSEVIDGGVTTWESSNFAGFYYDVDNNLGTEALTTTIQGNSLEEPDGVVYTTSAQSKDFDFETWGSYWTIGFLGEEHFAGYAEGSPYDAPLYYESSDPNLIAEDLISRVLISDDSEITLTSSRPLKLAEGYELSVKAIDQRTKIVSLELQKNGETIDVGTVEPSKDGATIQEKTYTYKMTLNGAEDVVVIAVHFKDAFSNPDQAMVIVNGIWQISDSPIDIKVGTTFDRMKVQMVDPTAMSITMNNEKNKIGLYKNSDAALMGDIRVKTANQNDVTPEDPLRFYVYREVVVEEAQAQKPSTEVGPS